MQAMSRRDAVSRMGMVAVGFAAAPVSGWPAHWFVQETVAEHFWKWLMQASAGGRNVMLATGGAASPPSARNAANRWIFSTTLTDDELAACARPRCAPPSGVPPSCVPPSGGRGGLPGAGSAVRG